MGGRQSRLGRAAPDHARFSSTVAPRLAPLPAAPDVVILGAGAAGIAAARRLLAAGLAVAVIEARDRVGGRALTTRLRGHAIDLGGHWLHAGSVNPLVALGHARGEPLRRAPEVGHLRIGRRPASRPERAALGRAFDRADRALTAGAAESGPDRPAASALPPVLGPWRARVAGVHGVLSGRPLDQVSLHDFPSMEFGENWFVRGGFGAYVARLAQGLPIRLGTAARRLDWSGGGVAVETETGRIEARAALVTLPVMVLSDPAALDFAPALPERVRAAIDGFLAGHYEHVVLDWPGSPFRGADLFASVAGRRPAPGVFSRIDGSAFHYLVLDHDAVRTVDRHDGTADAARRYARAALARLFGREHLRGIEAPAVTEWRHDPLSRGSWAVVPPGHAWARACLAEAVGDRVWFAGEALSDDQWGTVGGAWAEGERAADAIAARLKG
jgi:monoamine oxidase